MDDNTKGHQNLSDSSSASEDEFGEQESELPTSKDEAKEDENALKTGKMSIFVA